MTDTIFTFARYGLTTEWQEIKAPGPFRCFNVINRSGDTVILSSKREKPNAVNTLAPGTQTGIYTPSDTYNQGRLLFWARSQTTSTIELAFY